MTQPRCIFALHLHVPAGFVCAEHDHACTEIVFTNESAGRLIQGDSVYEYEPNSVFLYQPAVQHHVENDRAGTHLCLGVAGCDAEQLRPGVRRPSDTMRTLADWVWQALDDPPPRQAMRLDLLAGLLVAELHETEPAPALPHDAAPHDYAAAAKQMLETRYDEPIDIDELAASLFISPDYLRRLFRRQFGRSPVEYLIHRRVQVACEMLRHTDQAVSTIAERCGFNSPYYFSRVFKKVTGASPSAYRRSQTGGHDEGPVSP